MKKTTKALALVLCAMLLVVGSVMGTLAYLKDDATVTNTFTVGKVVISMDEAAVNEYGEALSGEARRGTNTYKLIPGHTYDKDPTIHVEKGSEDCWLFVKVVNEISEIEEATSIHNQMLTKDWTPIEENSNVYYKNHTKNENADVDYVVFDEFKIKNDADISTYGEKEIIVTAYAVQKDGLSDVNDAWAAASAVDSTGSDSTGN